MLEDSKANITNKSPSKKHSNIFKRIFSRKSSSKIKISKSNNDIITKSSTLPQPKIIPIETDHNKYSPIITDENHIKIQFPNTAEPSLTSSIYSEYPKTNIPVTNAPLASLESLITTHSNFSNKDNIDNNNSNAHIIPVINEIDCSANHSPLIENNSQITQLTNQYLQPTNIDLRNRKLSDDDSAVDLKFHDDYSSSNNTVQLMKLMRANSDTNSKVNITNHNSNRNSMNITMNNHNMIKVESSEASSSLSLGNNSAVVTNSSSKSTNDDYQCLSLSISSATTHEDDNDNNTKANDDDNIFINNSNKNITNAKLPVKRTESLNSWRKIKLALIWTPFIQQCSKHQYPWIQIAGHQGNFKPGEQGTILKKHCARESICLQTMREDILSDFVPEYKNEVNYEGEKYICMQDLLAKFDQPSLMDIKMGTRTYLEEELTKAQKCPKPRQDMYEKMIAVDPNEPTADEHKKKAILKPRYMIWRETLSSSVNLGFRIEGIKKVVGTQSRDYKKTKYREQVKSDLLDFIDGQKIVLTQFLERLKSVRESLVKSSFFWDHEFIGSSLLFVYDRSQKSNVWMIDFGKTIPTPPNVRINHKLPWQQGNHEDGYLFGLDNLISIFEEILLEFDGHRDKIVNNCDNGDINNNLDRQLNDNIEKSGDCHY